MAKILKSRFNFSLNPFKATTVVDKRTDIAKTPTIISASVPLNKTGTKRLFIGTGGKITSNNNILFAQVQNKDDRAPYKSIFTNFSVLDKDKKYIYIDIAFKIFYLIPIFFSTYFLVLSLKYETALSMAFTVVFALLLLSLLLLMRSAIEFRTNFEILLASNPSGIQPRMVIEDSYAHDNYSYEIAETNTVVNLSGVDIKYLIQLGKALEDKGNVQDALDGILIDKKDITYKSPLYNKLDVAEAQIRIKLTVKEEALQEAITQLIEHMDWTDFVQSGYRVKKGLDVK